MSAEITKINNINDYLNHLSTIKKDCLIIITVKDTPGFHIKDETISGLRGIGIKSDIQNKHGHSFIAVIDYGTVIIDNVSIYNESIVIENLNIHDGKIQLNIMSSIFQKENLSVMMINGIDYSLDKRGLNFLVFDCEKISIIDRISFDTHLISNPPFRKQMLSTHNISGITNSIGHRIIMDRLENLDRHIERLERNNELNNEKNNFLLWQIFRGNGENDDDMKRRFFSGIPSATGIVRKIQLCFKVMLKTFDSICRKNGIEYWLDFGTLLGAVRNNGFIPWDDDADVCMTRDQYLKLREVVKDDPDFFVTSFFDANGPDWKYYGRGYKFRFRNYRLPYMLDIFIFDYADETVKEHVADINSIKDQMCNDAWKKGSLPDIPETGVQNHRGIFEDKEIYLDHEKFFDSYLNRYKQCLGSSDKKTYIVWAIDNPNPEWGKRRKIDYNQIFPLREIAFENHMYLCPNKSESHLKMLYGDIFSVPDDILHGHFNYNNAPEKILDEIIDKFC